MRAKLSALSRDQFIRHNVVFFIGSITVAVLNYLYHPVMSRLMSVEEFGEVQALLALSVQLGILNTVSSVIAVNVFANKNIERREALRNFMSAMIYANVFIILLLMLSSGLITEKLQLSSSIPLFIIAVTLPLGLFSSLRNAKVQAEKKFTKVSIFQAIPAGGKLLFGALLVLAGFHSTGALLGVSIATALGLLYLYLQPESAIGTPLVKPQATKELKKEIHYGVLIFFSNAVISFFSTADIVIAKYLFDPVTAGHYAGISTVARIILFATGSIAGVLLSHIKLHHSRKENDRLLLKALLITAAIAGAGTLVLALIPNFVVKILIGAEYTELTNLMPVLAISMLIVSLINVLNAHSLAMQRKNAMISGLVGILVTALLLSIRNSSPTELVQNFLTGSSVTFVWFLSTHIFSRLNSKDEPNRSATIGDIPQEPIV